MLVEVALPLPIPRTFTYRAAGERPADGSRVLVPFGKRTLVGWVVGAGDAATADGVLEVHKVLERSPAVPAELLKLCRWVADYYLAPLGQVLRSALPAGLSDDARPEPPVKTRKVLQLVQDLPSLTARDELFGRARRQRECFEIVEASGGAVEVSHLTGHLGFSTSVVQGLVSRGVARIIDVTLERDPFADVPVVTPGPVELFPAQRQAVASLLDAARADRSAALQPFLLRGVTGSGKTQVYIELLREVVERQGRGAIVLVPEIALTPQTVARFRSYFGDAVAVLHSALSDGERYDAWRALRSRQRRVAIGARSAVFAPVPELGAIVVDEEHESTYKQSDTAPRYHAREVAIMRARMAGAVCVLGSATPSLESWHNASAGKFRLLELPERVHGRELPPVRVVDLRGAGKRDGRAGKQEARGFQILSEPLMAAMERRLALGEQIILLLNRRGYATFVQCRDCGNVWHCQRCNVSLTYHRARRRLVCHYCFHEEPPPITCPSCASGDLSFRGVGTEQVERAVSESFPAARLARMDVDTTSGKWAHHEILDRFGRAEVDILLGTQMIAKGLDFPRVTLVGVVNADVGLNLPDFRAGERTFQLLTQVAGRAGRGPGGGEVFVQTALPEHYAIRAALRHDYVGFAERELLEREGPGYPPRVRMANIVVSGTEEAPVQEAVEAASEWTLGRIEAHRAAVVLTGPAPCPIDRIRGRWRWHFLLRSGSSRDLGRVSRDLLERYRFRRGRAELRLALDRDPVALL